MGSNCRCFLQYSPLFPSISFSFSSSSSSSSSSVPWRRLNFPFCSPHHSVVSASHHILSSDLTWDDVVKLSPKKQGLEGFFEKVALCNRNSEKQCEFIPFAIEGQIVGYIHNGFAHHLRRYKEVFIFPEDSSYGSNFGYYVALHPELSAPQDRTKAVEDVVKCLGELIPGIRNEQTAVFVHTPHVDGEFLIVGAAVHAAIFTLYPVTSSFGTPEFFSLERAAAPYFGIKAYGVHMNGYVERDNQKYLWIARRSKEKPTYPGKLDHLVAGGLPHGISCGENLVKECEEEAGIPRSISSKATAVGAVSYLDIDGYRLKRDVLFCYDLKLPEGFVPSNEDGEVESFKLVPVTHVSNIIRSTHLFKENCNLVIIDFLVRHGYIRPEELGYLKLLQSLRSGDCT